MNNINQATKPAELGAGLWGQSWLSWPVLIIAVGWLAMFGPTYYTLSSTTWASDEQGHGPIILGIAAWLLYRKREALAELTGNVRPVLGSCLFVFGLLFYLLGRSQFIGIAEVGAQIAILGGLIMYYKGFRGLSLIKFPLFFLIFMIPLPPDFVGVVTAPLKSAVSSAAASLLYTFGYPVARSGVILSVGQYQLLVADACAGLNSMFTLEALGLLYMNILNHTAFSRNLVLAILIVPISFIANVIRVMILVLVTYHFGDAAGQGFVHSFAGMVLFMVALTLILLVDAVLGFIFKRLKA